MPVSRLGVFLLGVVIVCASADVPVFAQGSTWDGSGARSRDTGATEVAAADDAGAKLTPWGQVRSRLDYFEFAEPFIGLRSVLGLDASFGEWMARVELRDVRNYGDTPPGQVPQLGIGNAGTGGPTGIQPLDIHQAWAQGRLTGDLWIKAGRQEVNFDDQRIVGAFNWSHQGRSFDMIRLRYMLGGATPGMSPNAERGSIDLFWTPLDANGVLGGAPFAAPTRIMAQFFGVHATLDLAEDLDVSAFLYVLDTDSGAFNNFAATATPSILHTAGVYAASNAGQLVWNATLAVQAGARGFDPNRTDIFAYLAHAFVGYWVTPGATKVGVEANYGSGDKANTGQNEAWAPLFPTGHLFHGYFDREDGSNTVNAAIRAWHSMADPGLDFELSLWAIFVAERTPGTNVDEFAGAIPAGVTSALKAYEIDFTASYNLNETTNLLVGVIGWFPGRFIRDIQGPNGLGTDLRVYIQLTANFR